MLSLSPIVSFYGTEAREVAVPQDGEGFGLQHWLANN